MISAGGRTFQQLYPDIRGKDMHVARHSLENSNAYFPRVGLEIEDVVSEVDRTGGVIKDYLQL